MGNGGAMDMMGMENGWGWERRCMAVCDGYLVETAAHKSSQILTLTRFCCWHLMLCLCQSLMMYDTINIDRVISKYHFVFTYTLA